MQVRNITCPSCSASLDLRLPNAETISCSSCGSVIDLSDNLAILEKLQAKNFKPNSFLKLGMIGTIGGQEYQIIGRICYQSKLSEWDDEDNKYYSDEWPFDSWILVNEDYQYRYISEDTEGYYFSRPIVPTSPSVPSQYENYLSLFKDRPSRLILEKADSKIVYFEGEFTWRPKMYDRTSSAEYREGRFSYEVSWSYETDSNTKKEIEFYESYEVSKKLLAEAFGRKDIVQEEERKEKLSSEYMLWGMGFSAVAALLFFTFCISLISSGDTVFKERAPLESLTEDGSILGPFAFKESGDIYALRVRSDIKDNSWAWVAAELLNGDQEPINVVEKDAWRESGRDSDGSWHESSLDNHTYFLLDTPGTFYVRLFGEPGTAISGTATVSVDRGVMLSRYYVLASLFCIPIIFFLFNRANKIRPKSLMESF